MKISDTWLMFAAGFLTVGCAFLGGWAFGQRGELQDLDEIHRSADAELAACVGSLEKEIDNESNVFKDAAKKLAACGDDLEGCAELLKKEREEREPHLETP